MKKINNQYRQCSEEKASVRRKVLRILSTLDRRRIEQSSKQIMGNLFAMPLWEEAGIVLTYLTFRQEVNTDPIITDAFSGKKRVGIPRIRGRQMDFHFIPNREMKFKLSSYGIREPQSDWPLVNLSELTEEKVLVVVPGLAFDRNKNRIGRAGGYYDRWLHRARGISGIDLTAVALCFHEQLLDHVPHDIRDEPVDAILTDKGLACVTDSAVFSSERKRENKG